MTHKGADYETIILLKLGAIEARLKSFMASLEEPIKMKWRERFVGVKAHVNGVIIRWFWVDGAILQGTDVPLCEIEQNKIPLVRKIVWSHSVGGRLSIQIGANNYVSAGDTIAIIDTSFALV